VTGRTDKREDREWAVREPWNVKASASTMNVCDFGVKLRMCEHEEEDEKSSQPVLKLFYSVSKRSSVPMWSLGIDTVCDAWTTNNLCSWLRRMLFGGSWTGQDLTMCAHLPTVDCATTAGSERRKFKLTHLAEKILQRTHH
jgi:hypothetical protein